jgi:hypothetical protein
MAQLAHRSHLMSSLWPPSNRNLQEWDKLAKWVVNNKLFSHNVRWLIQVPRLYEVYKGTGAIKNFGDIVRSESISQLWTRSSALTLSIYRFVPAAVRGDAGSF